MKRCSKCGLQKDRFYRRSTSKDGFDSWCVDCSRDKSRRHYEYNKETVIAKTRAYYELHKEEKQQYGRDHYQANKEARKAYARAWSLENPEKVREAKCKSQAKRRAQMMAVQFEEIDPIVVFERDGWVCGICDGPIDKALRRPDLLSKSIDHIRPLSKGGSHTYDNVQASHLCCNVSKNAKLEVGD